MAKPPASAPHSDIDGVHRDGTRPSGTLPTRGADADDLRQASEEDAARPAYSNEESNDDRTG